MKFVAVIPARKGSKGLPEKNKKILCGKPLISYSIEAAMRANIDIIVSTDDPEIKQIGLNHGLKMEYARPDALSGDKVSMGATLLHVCDWLQQVGRNYDSMILLQPTSPFRTIDDILNGMKLHSESNGHHVLGVSPMWTHPFECIQVSCDENESSFQTEYSSTNETPTAPGYQLNKSEKWKFLSEPAVKALRRQDYSESFYFINGAFYCFKINQLRQLGQVPFEGAKLLKMSSVNTVDIDTSRDFLIAESLMRNVLEHGETSL